MNRPIVVGADGTEESLRAVDWAAREAARRAAPLRIVSVTVAPSPNASPHGPPETVDDALRSLYAQALTTTAGRAASLSPGLAIETELLSGRPARVLARDASGASMLVVGAGGAGEYGGVGVGPVSRYVAMHARCPVAVVRDPGEAAGSEIVVGVRDPHEAAAGALRFAFEEAALRGVPLRAVHAWYWFPPALLAPVAADAAGRPRRTGDAGSAWPLPEEFDARALSAETAVRLAEVLRGWQGKYPEVAVSQDVVHGHPGRVLADFSGRAGLVVLGRHDRHDGVRPGHGSVHYAVLSRARGPVAVVPSV
ncbi:MAG TPA: universal stress protein [Streptosporangiaceae bacterium]